MNTYRNVAVALAAGAACLSLAACSAGITTASSAGADAASSRSAAAVASSASAAAMASASASASRAAAGRMIKLDGLSVSFPVPTGAKVIENMAMNVDGKQTAIFFTLVTPAKVASFYTAALPRDGYKVTTNSLLSQTGSTVAFIQFSGHGIKGTIDSLAKFTESVGIPGLGHKNVTTISLQSK
ncbi:MAG TPA: hypothetical protein VFV73_20640 [Streptosporangiaceae bacterium]|nr:hypothetical protein [Streptosporangiaceae bacterium]